MACGYAAVTGRTQVVLLHAAAGLLQGANAIHGALLTGAPIVICSGEFGRSPFREGRTANSANLGRDHHPFSFTIFACGGGFKPGRGEQ